MPTSPLAFDYSILPLDSSGATLEQAGGKGANLSRLARAGFPVPGGFIIPAGAYRAFASQQGLLPRIQASLGKARLDDPPSLEQVSTSIRALFRVDGMPAGLVEAIQTAYRALGAPAVAVRSSATAEDLPELSFAGQQDTYLNVKGEEALLRAVAACWGSLWTARAIGYRQRQRVDQDDIALAVVVQKMAPAEAAGVLFTANPLSGLRSEVVIDATLGLGEALVSGKVEPDRYIVQATGWTIREKKLGAKALSVRGIAGGGVETVPEAAAGRQALPDAQILALAAMGMEVAGQFGAPQDIEWAWTGTELLLLQSRPITSLFPIPEGFGPQDLRALFSFGAVQGMLEPVTPLGQDLLQQIFAGGYLIFARRVVDEDSQQLAFSAGMRLWVDMTGLLRNPVGRRFARGALNYVEPGIGQIVDTIWDDPRLMPAEKRLRFATARRLAVFGLPMLGRILRNWAQPEARMSAFQKQVEDRLAALHEQFQQVSGSSGEKLARRVALARSLRYVGRFLAHNLISALMAAMSQFALLRSIAGQLDRERGTGQHYRLLVLEITRAIPHNVTTEMDLKLWETARAIQADPASLELFQGKNTAELASAYRARAMPPTALAALDRFLERYGMRGVGEIDLGRIRWSEDPTQVLEVLGSYLQMQDPEAAPDAVFRRGARQAEAAVEELARAARQMRGGWLKARQVRFAARRTRALLGAREAPKFTMVRVLGMIRQALLDSGREYVQAGLLAREDDLFYLRLKELEALARGQPGDWQAKIDARRAELEREKRRRQVPRLLMSDGRAFYEGIGAQGGAMHGDPVSPGMVEGAVRVVLDPRGAQLAPGEILVCPGTDPAWTPLFLAAGGLVMEVGGMMTHGAVVAREYGIPAVVGVHEATRRLQTGQRIRVNGSTGEIDLVG